MKKNDRLTGSEGKCPPLSNLLEKGEESPAGQPGANQEGLLSGCAIGYGIIIILTLVLDSWLFKRLSASHREMSLKVTQLVRNWAVIRHQMSCRSKACPTLNLTQLTLDCWSLSCIPSVFRVSWSLATIVQISEGPGHQTPEAPKTCPMRAEVWFSIRSFCFAYSPWVVCVGFKLSILGISPHFIS